MTAPDGQRWAIIGGGILGMTLAVRLAQRGVSVSLIERAEQLGGLASAWRLGDVVWPAPETLVTTMRIDPLDPPPEFPVTPAPPSA